MQKLIIVDDIYVKNNHEELVKFMSTRCCDIIRDVMIEYVIRKHFNICGDVIYTFKHHNESFSIESESLKFSVKYSTNSKKRDLSFLLRKKNIYKRIFVVDSACMDSYSKSYGDTWMDKCNNVDLFILLITRSYLSYKPKYITNINYLMNYKSDEFLWIKLVNMILNDTPKNELMTLYNEMIISKIYVFTPESKNIYGHLDIETINNIKLFLKIHINVILQDQLLMNLIFAVEILINNI